MLAPFAPVGHRYLTRNQQRSRPAGGPPDRSRKRGSAIGRLDRAGSSTTKLGVSCENPRYSRMQSGWKLSRGLGIANLMKHPSPLRPRSRPQPLNSEARALALGPLADCSTKIIYQQESSEATHTAEVLGHSVIERSRLPDLQRGEGLWRVGQRAFADRRLVTDSELKLFDTNSRIEIETKSEHLSAPDDLNRLKQGAGPASKRARRPNSA